jgi:hypothetical protein
MNFTVQIILKNCGKNDKKKGMCIFRSPICGQIYYVDFHNSITPGIVAIKKTFLMHIIIYHSTKHQIIV